MQCIFSVSVFAFQQSATDLSVMPYSWGAFSPIYCRKWFCYHCTSTVMTSALQQWPRRRTCQKAAEKKPSSSKGTFTFAPKTFTFRRTWYLFCYSLCFTEHVCMCHCPFLTRHILVFWVYLVFHTSSGLKRPGYQLRSITQEFLPVGKAMTFAWWNEMYKNTQDTKVSSSSAVSIACGRFSVWCSILKRWDVSVCVGIESATSSGRRNETITGSARHPSSSAWNGTCVIPAGAPSAVAESSRGWWASSRSVWTWISLRDGNGGRRYSKWRS